MSMVLAILSRKNREKYIYTIFLEAEVQSYLLRKLPKKEKENRSSFFFFANVGQFDYFVLRLCQQIQEPVFLQLELSP